MDPLASTAALAIRNIDTSDLPLAEEMLRVASAAVRGAAGSPISRVTSVIKYDGWACERYLNLFGPPVTAVTAVTVDGVAVTDWRLQADGRLWRSVGWSTDEGPADVRVTQTHGLVTVQEEIVDLVCQYAAVGMSAARASYAAHAGIVTQQIGDYSVTYAQGADSVAAAMEIPERTRNWLASMFGGSAAVLTTRS